MNSIFNSWTLKMVKFLDFKKFLKEWWIKMNKIRIYILWSSLSHVDPNLSVVYSAVVSQKAEPTPIYAFFISLHCAEFTVVKVGHAAMSIFFVIAESYAVVSSPLQTRLRYISVLTAPQDAIGDLRYCRQLLTVNITTQLRGKRVSEGRRRFV